MADPNALLLTGSGLLNSLACRLVDDGWRVVLPARRYTPLPADEGRDGASGRGKAVWVEAHWDQPRRLARDVDKALTEPAGLLVAWVHDSYRRAVLGLVESLLTPAAAVVEVFGPHLTEEEPRPLLVSHRTQQVLLGDLSGEHAGRPLGQGEILAGVSLAVERALDGRPSSVHQIGEPRSVR